MRIGLLGNDYRNFMLLVCEALKAEPVILEWTENFEQELAQIKAADVDFVMIHGHANYHGFALAPMVLERLKIEPLVISSAGFRRLPIEHPIPVSRGYDHTGDSELQEAIAQIRLGPITHGGAARWVIQQVCEAEDNLAKAREILKEAEQSERAAQESKRKYLQLCREIRQRKNQRAKK